MSQVEHISSESEQKQSLVEQRANKTKICFVCLFKTLSHRVSAQGVFLGHQAQKRPIGASSGPNTIYLEAMVGPNCGENKVQQFI